MELVKYDDLLDFVWEGGNYNLVDLKNILNFVPKIKLPDDYNFDRITYLINADKKHRCLVLPCKVGDTLYVLTTDSLMKIKKIKCTNIRIYGKNKIVIEVPCPYDDETGTWWEFTADKFGEKVFLTKEEAEKALEGLE